SATIEASRKDAAEMRRVPEPEIALANTSKPGSPSTTARAADVSTIISVNRSHRRASRHDQPVDRYRLHARVCLFQSGRQVSYRACGGGGQFQGVRGSRG